MHSYQESPTRVLVMALLLGILAASLGEPVSSAPTAANTLSIREPGKTKPNVLLILADDLGYGDISAYKRDWIPTPNIDSLGKDGIRCTDAHVSASVCAPSRAGLHTGRYGTRHGSEFNAGAGLNLDEKTLGELLKEAGYVSGAIGKWHLGMEGGRAPLQQGFDEFFGLKSGSLYISSKHPDAVNGKGVSREAAPRTGKRLRPVYRGNRIVEENEYLTEAFTREAMDFIRRHKEKPFFLYLAYNAPHAPLQTTKKYYDRFPAVTNQDTRIYAGMVSALDDGVGRVLETLQAEGVFDNTIVIFLSDNGCPNYIGTGCDGCSNGLLNGWKRYHHEGGHRVPFFIKWSGHLPAGLFYDKTISSLDVYPTLAAISGGSLPGDRRMDGVNLLPFLTGADPGIPHPELCWRAGGNFAVRDGKWKLIVANLTKPEELANIREDEGGGLLDHPPYPGVSPLGQHVMLYNLAEDLGETNNVAARYPEVVAALRQKWEQWNKENVPSNARSSRACPVVIDGQVLELAF